MLVHKQDKIIWVTDVWGLQCIPRNWVVVKKGSVIKKGNDAGENRINNDSFHATLGSAAIQLRDNLIEESATTESIADLTALIGTVEEKTDLILKATGDGGG